MLAQCLLAPAILTGPRPVCPALLEPAKLGDGLSEKNHEEDTYTYVTDMLEHLNAKRNTVACCGHFLTHD